MMEHYYQDIQGWFNFSGLYRRMVQEMPEGAHFAEIGCWKGRSAAFLAVEMINADKGQMLHCIDHWKGSEEHEQVPTNLFNQFINNVKPVMRCVGITRADSVRAAKNFADDYFHFVFIDAGHDYDSVIADINAWLPKVKKGGVIAGDDYPMKGVSQAVNELIPNVQTGQENGWEYWWANV